MMIKLALNHLQVIAMVALFPLQWPESVKYMFEIVEVVSVSGGESAMFSFARSSTATPHAQL